MLYRRERRFPAWLAVLMAVVVAFPTGFLLGRGTAPAPDLAELLGPSVAAVRAADGSLDIVLLEYARSAAADADAADQRASRDAAAAAAQRGSAELERAQTLAKLNPSGMAAAEGAFTTLAAAIEARAHPQDVAELSEAARRALEALIPEL